MIIYMDRAEKIIALKQVIEVIGPLEDIDHDLNKKRKCNEQSLEDLNDLMKKSNLYFATIISNLGEHKQSKIV